MIIEIYTHQNEVPEHIIFYLKGKLMDFYHRDNQIDKTEVVLRHRHINEANEYVCEVTLSLHGETLLIHRSGESYLQAIREVLRELSLKINEFLQREKDLPEEIISTVRV